MRSRSNSDPYLPKTGSPVYVQAPRSEGTNAAIAIAELQRCGHTQAVAKAIVAIPGYLDAHHKVFTKAPNPLADGADLRDLSDHLCVVCRAWLECGYARESSALLERLLSQFPQAPEALELLKAHAHTLLGGISHKAPGILAAAEVCLLQPDLPRKTRQALIELANHLHPATGLKLELMDLRLRLSQTDPSGPDQQNFDPAQELLTLCVQLQALDEKDTSVEALLALADTLKKAIESRGQHGGEDAPLKRIASLKRRRLRRLIKELQHQMLPWLKLWSEHDEDARTQRCSLKNYQVACPRQWGKAEANTAWGHFLSWLAAQLEDPLGLPWAELPLLVQDAIQELDKKCNQAAAIQLFRLSCREALPLDARRGLLLCGISQLRSNNPGSSPPLADEAHAECLRALCALSEAAPDQCAGLFQAYREKTEALRCVNKPLKKLIKLAVQMLSPSQESERDILLEWTRIYATLSLDPGGSHRSSWRIVCQPLLRRWIVATRHNAWAHELFLQALRTLSMSRNDPRPLYTALPTQAHLLLDQWALMPTPQERTQWLNTLDGLCAQSKGQQTPGDSTPPSPNEQYRLIALRGTIRHLLSRDQGKPVSGPSDVSAPLDPAVAFFEQWAELTLDLAQRQPEEAKRRLETIATEHERAVATDPRFGDALDRLITGLISVEQGRFERASQ